MTARYRALAESVLGQITRGDLLPGDPLPSYRSLAVEHGVSLDVVMAAMRWLGERGNIRTERGRGAFVADPQPVNRGSLEDRVRSLEEWREQHESQQH